MAEKKLAPWRPFKDLSSFGDRLGDSSFWGRPLARMYEWVSGDGCQGHQHLSDG
jgi:hypothetical protein